MDSTSVIELLVALEERTGLELDVDELAVTVIQQAGFVVAVVDDRGKRG